MTAQARHWAWLTALIALLVGTPVAAQSAAATDPAYEHEETRALMSLVNDASGLVRAGGEAAFADFRVSGSRWRQGETYVFVLDPQGTMVVHPDPALEGTNQLALKDINGKPIIRGLIDAAAADGMKPSGWYHYEWPVPGELLPRWKSAYVQKVAAPSGKSYIVGAGMYNDRMEREFVVDAVDAAVALVEKEGRAAFPRFHDPRGPFMAKDAYVFVVDANGIDLVNPGFPNLEGRNLLDVKDTTGKRLIRDMLDVIRTRGSGWIDYMWPKPGDNVSTQKSTYVRRARFGDTWVMVGCGVYLADAPRAEKLTSVTAADLMALVHDATQLLHERGEQAYAQFREPGSRWLHDDTYLFVWDMDGTRVFHGANPESEGEDVSGMKDVLGRPTGRMILDVAKSAAGEGWIHYMYPEPGDIFPTWKSTFLQRVTFPSGTQFVVGAGIYNMRMESAFIRDVVDRAAELVAAKGPAAFATLRDKTGPFMFMDTYVFVDTPDGVELVNAAQPSLEGTNVMALKDPMGKAVVDDYIRAAMKQGSTWVEYHWYPPGSNTPAPKATYVRKVESGGQTYIVGSGMYIH